MRGRHRPAGAFALASFASLATALASCSQLLGLRDDLDVAEAGAADDAGASDTGDGAPNADATAHDDAGRDDADLEPDAPPSFPPCVAGATGVCVVKTLNVAPAAFAAAGLTVYYGGGAAFAGVTRLTSEGAPAAFSFAAGIKVASIAALSSYVALGGVGPNTGDQTVAVTALDGTSAGATAAMAPPPSAVALTSTHVAWLTGSSVLSSAANAPQGTQNAVATSGAGAVVGGGTTLAVTLTGSPIKVKTSAPDGTGGDLYTLPGAATIVRTGADPAGAVFAAVFDGSTTSVDSLAGAVVTTIANGIAGAPKGIAVSTNDVFLALDLGVNASGQSVRKMVRVSRTAAQLPDVLHETTDAVGLVAHDGTYAYWVEVTSANRSTIYRWALP